MILYDKLYRSEDYKEISVMNYLPALIDEIMANFENPGSIIIEKRIGDFPLGAKKLQPLGIIINELLTNIMKYAFADRTEGLITVSAEIEGNRAVFIVADNGTGLPVSIDFEHSTGFGMQLISMLTAQLNGIIRVERENGTKFILEFDV
jgi:two-component sensor histidine kinase